MKELVFKNVENAFGIKKLRVHIENENKMFQELIYSRNGTFKTSFSKMLYEANNGILENIFDRLTNKKGIINISIVDDESETNDLRNNFIVFSREIYEKNPKLISDYENELATLTIDKEDSEDIKELLTEDTLEIKLSINNYLKGVGVDFDGLLNIFTSSDNGYLDRVIKLIDTIINFQENDISEINIKKIFQRAYDIVDQDKFQKKIANYINVLEKKVNAKLFDDNFNEMNCPSFISTLDKSKYLNKEKSRGLAICDEIYYDIEDIKKVFQNEIDKISSDPEILEQSKEIVKVMGTAKEAENLKKSIQSNPLLVKQLSLGRNNILLSYLKKAEIDYKYWFEVLNKAKNELIKALQLAVSKKTKFEKAIEIYKERFHPIFDIKIINKEESLLGLEVPSISFYHNRLEKEQIEEKELNEILSSGEKTTLNILKFIVEYESCKRKNPFVVLDDIVETFDYSNRYAFIEYINDLVNLDVPIIVLTHNFEFFNNVGKRIKKLRKSTAISTKDGIVDIQINKRISKSMEDILKCNSIEEFYSAIPYLREAKIILNEDTNRLNACLHYKKDTQNVKNSDILKLFPIDFVKSLTIDKEKYFLEQLHEIASDIKNFDNFDLTKKTLLAIACRVSIEQKIIKNDFSLIENVKENQTAYILDKFGSKLTEHTKSCLEEVQLSTPEFIHGNAFMYEPLIDIDGEYLVKLYKKIILLEDDKIWK